MYVLQANTCPFIAALLALCTTALLPAAWGSLLLLCSRNYLYATSMYLSHVR